MSKIHIVKKTFRAIQYPGGNQEAIGVHWKVIKDLEEYKFQIQHRPRVFYVDVKRAIEYAERYPPIKNANGFLFAGRVDQLIIPEHLWTTKEENQQEFKL